MRKATEGEPTVYSWDEQTSGLIDWFLSQDLPGTRFRLRGGAEVAEPEKFYASLRSDIEQGVEGARARTGALQEDLESLFDHLNERDESRDG
jgi:hypothetical protein